MKFDQQGVIERDLELDTEDLALAGLLSLRVKTVHRSNSPFSTTLTQFVLFPTVTKQISETRKVGQTSFQKSWPLLNQSHAVSLLQDLGRPLF